MNTRQRQRILVPTRSISGGMDWKFEDDSYNVKLYDILTAEEYTSAIQRVNETIKPSRSKKIDSVLLLTGPTIVPLIAWGFRHHYLTKKRKRLLQRAVEDFHKRNPHLLMRWNRRPDSVLSIEMRPVPESTVAIARPVIAATFSPTAEQVSGNTDDLLVFVGAALT